MGVGVGGGCLLLLILAIRVQMMWFFFSPAQADSAVFPLQAFKTENKLVFTFLIKPNRFESGESMQRSSIPLSGSSAFMCDLLYMHVAMRLRAHI